jgi:hypothetical protein
MWIIDKLLSLVPVSDRSEIQFHRIHTLTSDGERQMITFITGEIVEEPTVVGSTSNLEIPNNTVLIEHGDKKKFVEINGKYYTIFEYTTHPPSKVPPNINTKVIPKNLQGKAVLKCELSINDINAIQDVLP